MELNRIPGCCSMMSLSGNDSYNHHRIEPKDLLNLDVNIDTGVTLKTTEKIKRVLITTNYPKKLKLVRFACYRVHSYKGNSSNKVCVFMLDVQKLKKGSFSYKDRWNLIKKALS